MKAQDRSLWEDSANGHENSKNSVSSRGTRRTRYKAEPRVTRNKGVRNKRQKTYEEDDDSDVEIPGQYQKYFDLFTDFIDKYTMDNPVEENISKVVRKRNEKTKISSKTSNKDSEMNKSYASESQAKFLHETQNQSSSNQNEDQTPQVPQGAPQIQNQEAVDHVEQNSGSNAQSASAQNNHELLLQLLQAQSAAGQIPQNSNQNSLGK